jgi:hypothetical protein
MAISGWLKQSTAVTVMVGPFVDDTDGNTAETALTIAQADVRLSKNGANIAQKNEATSCTHDEIGIYSCLLDTTDTNTLGVLSLIVHESGALHVRHDYLVLPGEIFDALVSGTTTENTAVVAATGGIIAKINMLFEYLRNKTTTTATTITIRNDADGADIASSTISDDATTFTKGEFS